MGCCGSDNKIAKNEDNRNCKCIDNNSAKNHNLEYEETEKKSTFMMWIVFVVIFLFILGFSFMI